jgi:hypothetical protein
VPRLSFGPVGWDNPEVRLSPYLYALSLPERTLRSVGALSGGLLRGVSDLVLPKAVRDTALYRATAGIGLRFLIQQVGNVAGIYPNSDSLSRKFVLRYAAGSSIEMASILTIFVSPVWVLAALGDATRVAKTLFVEIGEALQQEGLLDPKDRFETMAQLLDGLERTSTHLALTVNMPPLDISGLRAEWEQFRANLAALPTSYLPSPAKIENAWRDLRSTSNTSHQSVLDVSTAMALSARRSVPSNLQRLSQTAAVAGRTTGMVVGGVFLEHYAAASKQIAATGFGPYWAKHSRPYLVAAIRNFLPEKRTWLERQLTKLWLPA